MDSKKRVGTYFREGEEKLDLVPSAAVWEKIERDLDEKKKKRRIFFFWFYFIGFLLMSSGAFIAFKNGSPTPTDSNTNKENENVSTAVTNRSGDSKKVKSHFNTTNASAQTNTEVNTEFNLKPNRTNESKNSILAYKKNNSTKNTKTTKNTKILKKNSKDIHENQTVNRIKENNTKPSIQNYTLSLSDTKYDNRIPASKTNDSLKTKSEDEKKPITQKQTKNSLSDTLASQQQENESEVEISIFPYFGYATSGYFGNFSSISSNTVTDKKLLFQPTFGVMARWKFNEKMGLQLGLGKLNTRYKFTIENSPNSFLNDSNLKLNTSSQALYTLFTDSNKVTFTYESSFYEIPLEAFYQIEKGRINIAPIFGFSYLIANENKIYVQSENVAQKYIGRLDTDSNSSITANAKVQFSYKINPHFYFDLNPGVQFRLFGNTDKASYSNYIVTFKTSISYKF